MPGGIAKKMNLQKAVSRDERNERVKQRVFRNSPFTGEVRVSMITTIPNLPLDGQLNSP